MRKVQQTRFSSKKREYVTSMVAHWSQNRLPVRTFCTLPLRLVDLGRAKKIGPPLSMPWHESLRSGRGQSRLHTNLMASTGYMCLTSVPSQTKIVFVAFNLDSEYRRTLSFKSTRYKQRYVAASFVSSFCVSTCMRQVLFFRSSAVICRTFAQRIVLRN